VEDLARALNVTVALENDADASALGRPVGALEEANPDWFT